MQFEEVLAALPLIAQLTMMAERWIRVVTYRRRGVRVLSHHRNRPLGDHLFDLTNLVVYVFWIYMLVVEALRALPAWLPEALKTSHINSLPVRLLGAVLVLAGPVLYEISLRQMGDSWRLGVDRKKPGPLVTNGLFAWTRNPIYVAFDLLFIGTFLVTGRVIFLLLGGALILFMHFRILREERYLIERFGDAFIEYKSRVRRYGVI